MRVGLTMPDGVNDSDTVKYRKSPTTTTSTPNDFCSTTISASDWIFPSTSNSNPNLSAICAAASCWSPFFIVSGTYTIHLVGSVCDRSWVMVVYIWPMYEIVLFDVRSVSLLYLWLSWSFARPEYASSLLPVWWRWDCFEIHVICRKQGLTPIAWGRLGDNRHILELLCHSQVLWCQALLLAPCHQPRNHVVLCLSARRQSRHLLPSSPAVLKWPAQTRLLLLLLLLPQCKLQIPQMLQVIIIEIAFDILFGLLGLMH